MESSTSWAAARERCTFLRCRIEPDEGFSDLLFHKQKEVPMSRYFSSRSARNARFGSVWCSVFGIVALAVLLTFSGRPAIAQVLFGSVVGSVIDASGASVPNATVRITEV